MCCRERLRVIVFDKIAVLSSERELYIAPTYSILIRSRSIFVWSDPWLGQVASNFFHALIIVQQVNCNEKHGLPVPVETCDSWDQSTWNCWMYSDVIDVLGEVLWYQYIGLQCRSTRGPSECSWMALKNRKCLEELGVQAILKPFLGSFSLCQTSYPIVNWPLRSTIELCLAFSIRSSNRTAPSSSRGIDGSCRSNLIMASDTVRQSWRIQSGLKSIQFLSRTGIEMGDSVTVGIGRGFAFATGFPVTLCSELSREMVSDVSVTYLSIPFSIRTQETVLSRNRDSTMIAIP